MSKRLISLLAATSMLALSGCGYSSQDRVLSGAGLGAAAGTAGAVIVGGSVSTGILLGTAAGAVVGGVTEGDQINLGTPLWKQKAR